METRGSQRDSGRRPRAGRGLFGWFGFDIPPVEGLEAICHHGFETVMLYWSDEFFPKAKLVEAARRLGLHVVNGHLPFIGLNDLWLDAAAGDAYMAWLTALIGDAASLGVDTLVIHPNDGPAPPPVSAVGLDRYRRLAETAASVNVTLALENVQVAAHWIYLLEAIGGDLMKICYDSGHNHCAEPVAGRLADWPGRVAAVHLHDNDSTADQHLIPFQGTIDWAEEMRLLREIGYAGPLTLEVMGQTGSDPDAYLDRAGEALSRLEALFEQPT